MLFFLDVVLVAGAVTILPRRCLTLIASKGLASGDKIPAVDTAASEVEEALDLCEVGVTALAPDIRPDFFLANFPSLFAAVILAFVFFVFVLPGNDLRMPAYSRGGPSMSSSSPDVELAGRFNVGFSPNRENTDEDVELDEDVEEVTLEEPVLRTMTLPEPVRVTFVETEFTPVSPRRSNTDDFLRFLDLSVEESSSQILDG